MAIINDEIKQEVALHTWEQAVHMRQNCKFRPASCLPCMESKRAVLPALLSDPGVGTVATESHRDSSVWIFEVVRTLPSIEARKDMALGFLNLHLYFWTSIHRILSKMFSPTLILGSFSHDF